ncbi:hypothetical protein CDEST_06227 [Colletotrichum destructivum]|uniref:Uncharacterized protein n=1 Tax=Colletotrichum destructivum TaxID=34406 RepID=A0AAX4ICU8_9PEZI|nr:hypothetical protein CDEST_06227 [Colletotrichum destructivum]
MLLLAAATNRVPPRGVGRVAVKAKRTSVFRGTLLKKTDDSLHRQRQRGHWHAMPVGICMLDEEAVAHILGASDTSKHTRRATEQGLGSERIAPAGVFVPEGPAALKSSPWQVPCTEYSVSVRWYSVQTGASPWARAWSEAWALSAFLLLPRLAQSSLARH